MCALSNKEIISLNIKKYLALSGKTAAEVCHDLNIKNNTFSDWVNAKIYPRIDKIELLANYFNIPKSALIENKSNQEGPSIGECIKIKRKALGLTLEEVGKLIGVSKQTVQRYETGEIANIPYGRLVLLSKALHCSPADFLFDKKDPEDDNFTQHVFVDLFCRLSSEQQTSIILLMKSMLPGAKL